MNERIDAVGRADCEQRDDRDARDEQRAILLLRGIADSVAVALDSVMRRTPLVPSAIERAPVRDPPLPCKFSVASLAPFSRCKSSRARDDMLRCRSAAAATSASCASIGPLPDAAAGDALEGVLEDDARIAPDLPDSIARFSRCKSARISPAV